MYWHCIDIDKEYHKYSILVISSIQLSPNVCYVLCCTFKRQLKQFLPESHTLSTPGCHGMLPALHQSWSSPLGTQSTPTTRWRALISSLSSGPLPYSHAGKSTLVKYKICCNDKLTCQSLLGTNLGLWVNMFRKEDNVHTPDVNYITWDNPT